MGMKSLVRTELKYDITPSFHGFHLTLPLNSGGSLTVTSLSGSEFIIAPMRFLLFWGEEHKVSVFCQPIAPINPVC